MKAYLIKLSNSEEGPYDEAQMAQLFANGRIDRNTPCKPADRGEWKTIDDYLPMLKYGTQLPPASKVPAIPPALPPPILLSQSSQRISIVDLDIPFWSVLRIVFKWMAAALIVGLCLMPVAILIWLFVMMIWAALIGGAMSSFHHP